MAVNAQVALQTSFVILIRSQANRYAAGEFNRFRGAQFEGRQVGMAGGAV